MDARLTRRYSNPFLSPGIYPSLWEVSLTQEEEIVHQLAQRLLGQFPAAMDSPLVGAGVFGTEKKAFCTFGKNVMILSATSGYDTMHAEEQALSAYLSAPGEQPKEELWIVTTLEPCRDRQPKTKAPCCERIAGFVEGYGVENIKVIIGILETGKGIRFLLDKKLRVVLLHGEAQKRLIEEKYEADGRDARAVVKDLEREFKSKPQIRALLQVIDATKLDSINEEEHQRFLRTIKLRQDRTGEVLEAIKAAQQVADPFLMMQSAFPAIFHSKVRRDFEKFLMIARAEPLAINDTNDTFERFVRNLVRGEANNLRNQKIENELRNPEK
jgi:pyrimidine deaminase RibD-like protein